MIPLPPEPTERDGVIKWARAAQRCFRDIDRRLGNIIIPRQRTTEESISRLATRPFQLLPTKVDGSPKIRVVTSTLAGEPPSGFSEGDDPPYLLTPSGSAGFVWGGVTIDPEDGTIVENGVFLDIGDTVPEDEDDTFYVQIGSWTLEAGVLTVVNDRYGPIDANICRNWFAAASPFYGVTFIGS